MSHIIKTQNDTIKISSALEKLRSKGYNENIIEEILSILIPQNEKLPIDVVIGNSKTPAFVNENDKKIEVSPDELKNYINNRLNLLFKSYPNLSNEIFYNHVLLVLTHEVEHYYQSLIKNEYVEFPYKIVVDSYKNLEKLDIPKDLNPILTLIKIKRFFKYSHEADSLLERSANVEAYDLLLKVAKYENNSEMIKILNDLLSFQLTLGYKGYNNGSMEKTYNKKGLTSIYDKFDHTEIIPIEDKVRYGLPIDKETRKKVLRKQFKI